MTRTDVKIIVQAIALFFMIGLIILFMAAMTPAAAQTQPFVRTISKEGLKTDKDCKWVQVTADMVVFHVSGSTYEVFDLVGKDREGNDRWDSRATGKQAFRSEQNGLVVFQKTEKKFFAYTKE